MTKAVATDGATEAGPAPARRIVGVWVGLLALLFLAVAWAFARPALAGSPDRPWPAVALFLVCWLALGAITVGGFLFSLGTRLDRTGASQPSLRGRVVIPWSEVVSVEHAAHGKLILSDGTRKIAITGALYPDMNALYDWIGERLRAAGAVGGPPTSAMIGSQATDRR